MEDLNQIRLFVAPEVRTVLENRRLRDDEIRKTISEAEQTKQKFVHPETGHFLAGMRQGSVTVWVEYSPQTDGFVVFKAYQHRVEINAWDLKTGRTR
jgi:hypothetical protein